MSFTEPIRALMGGRLTKTTSSVSELSGESRQILTFENSGIGVGVLAKVGVKKFRLSGVCVGVTVSVGNGVGVMVGVLAGVVGSAGALVFVARICVVCPQAVINKTNVRNGKMIRIGILYQ